MPLLLVCEVLYLDVNFRKKKGEDVPSAGYGLDWIFLSYDLPSYVDCKILCFFFAAQWADFSIAMGDIGNSMTETDSSLKCLSY